MSKVSKITPEDFEQYLSLIEDGYSQRKACEILGLKRSTLQDYIKRKQKEQASETEEVKFDLSDSFKALNSGVAAFAKALATNKSKIDSRLNKYHSTEHGKEFEDFDLFEEQKPLSNKKPTILVIADTQVKPTESLEYILWIGKYIYDTKPDIVVMIGDWWDFPSLSSYDKGKASSEGRRFVDDLNAGNKGLELLELEINKDSTYKPRKVFCKGNHEHRVDRYVEDNPELKGTLGTEFLPLEKYGWEVYDFLKPVEIEGIYFLHYLANPMTGKPYTGTAANILKTVGKSFVVGHKQVLDLAIRPTFDGKQQIGIVNGACYPFEESYKGYFGNVHYRGVTVLTEVHDGFGLPSFVSLDYMKEKYYEWC